MPRATRSSTRSTNMEEPTTPRKTPKKLTATPKNTDPPLTSPSKAGRQSRKNPPSPQTPKTSKRRKQQEEAMESDLDSIATSTSSSKKTTPPKPAKASGDKTSPKTPRTSARNSTAAVTKASTPAARPTRRKSISKTETTPDSSVSTTRRGKRPVAEVIEAESPSPKKKPAPKLSPQYTQKGRQKRSRKSAEIENTQDNSDAENNSSDKELIVKRPRTTSPLSSIKQPLPKRLSRVELYDEALKNLASKLNMFDLTDPSDATNMWCDWPAEDGPLTMKDIHTLLLSRSWYSPSSQAASTSLANGNGASAREDSSQASVREIDVISYCLAHLTNDSQNIDLHKKQIEKELTTYKADIYCFQNVDLDFQNFLRDKLKTQGCTFSTTPGSNLIGFHANQFTLLSQHKVSAMKFAKDIVEECAYPASWCHSIKEVLTNSQHDEMLVTVLLHKSSNQVILVASHSLLPDNEHSGLSRPDITALNITGALWNLSQIWQDQHLSEHTTVQRNGQPNGPSSRSSNLSNGFNEETNGHSNSVNSQKMSPRWLLCGPFNATEKSPIYQLARDGYPDDQTLDRLRCLKTVELPSHPPLHTPPIDPLEGEETLTNEILNGSQCKKKKALIDLLWNAFQHPCTDVTSCYQAVVGREPPFTRVSANTLKTTQVVAAPMDYIWCSGSTLKPQTVLMPPCRALSSALNGKQTTSNIRMQSAIPLMARMRLVPTAS